MSGSRFATFKNADLRATVDDFITSWAAQAKLDVDLSLVTLRLVSVAGEAPTAEEEAAARELRPHRTLAAEGVADGSWLLASVASVAASLPGVSVPSRALAA